MAGKIILGMALMLIGMMYVAPYAIASPAEGIDAFCVGVIMLARVWGLAVILVPVLVGVIPIAGGAFAIRRESVAMGFTMIVVGVFAAALVFALMSSVSRRDIEAICQ
jgi:membrane protein CcdC involved in cytochrome C biogenesis